ncbi:LpxI family protein [Halarsenatibacter silvermanii]|uniref:DUF1009 domain-containing protein n=1 Tax=Halarsenatibacter silvermanii TaxID=321763 RepID=A0A1G9HU32_9FIRM|nr:UDP-2,3-diacylglucosamine diphosphatase LpxI [Halarsenatibacter silvermanii]SDL16083.1 hypothetical protein SAMN04488692_10225 [Halarsenatibacter silvermanii]
MTRTALIAGGDKLPEIWLERAQKAGLEVVAYRIHQEATPPLEKAERVRDIELGRLGDLLDLMDEDNIEDVIMLGKVYKERLYEDIELDEEMQLLLAGLPDYEDETILEGIAGKLEDYGYRLLPQDLYMDFERPKIGLLAGDESQHEGLEKDFARGMELAQRMAGLEIGQTVLLRDGAVLAVEAAEGTDKTIKRAGRLGGAGAIMAKAARPEQDDRLDIPAVGPKTIELLAEIEAAGLVIEAGGVMIIEKEEFLRKAEKSGIAVQSRRKEDID